MKKGWHWTKKDDNFLRKWCGKKTAEEISKMINRTPNAVRSRFTFLNLKSNLRTKYTHNKYYFSKLTLENCYWAGFIAADGSVSGNTLSISSIAKKDKHQLIKFASAINFNGRLEKYKRKNKYEYSIRIHKADMVVNDLRRHFNIVPKKSLILRPPKGLSNKQKIAYIIGYIDGDGSVSIINRYGYCLNIYGTYRLLNWIKCIFDNNFSSYSHCYASVCIKKNISHYCLQGRRAKNIIDYLSNIKVPSLRRKLHK